MYEYNHTKDGIEYVVFDPPMDVPMGKALEYFPDGGALVYRVIEDHIFVKLYVRSISRIPKVCKDHLWRRYLKNSWLKMYLTGREFILIRPVEDRIIYDEPREYLLSGAVENGFFEAGELRNYIERSFLCLNIKPDEIWVYYSSKECVSGTDILFTVYGYGSKDPKELFSEVLLRESKVKAMNAIDYLTILSVGDLYYKSGKDPTVKLD